MNKSIFASVAIAAAIATSGIAYAAPIITVKPWLAPNAYGSPSWTGAVANANYALAHGLSSYGPANDPTDFKVQTTPVSMKEVIVTGFPSWLGQTNPGSVFGPQYANELGNRMTFGLMIDGNGSQFSISQLYFNATSVGDSGGLDFGYGAGGYTYSLDYEGVQKGADGVLWTADDVYVTSGSNTQLVDGLVGRGSGNSYDAYCPACTLAQQQDALNLAAAGFGEVKFTGEYGLLGFDNKGSATFDINNPAAAPEPITASLFGAGLFGLGFLRRKKNAMTT